MATFIPNRRVLTEKIDSVPFSHVDVLFSYQEWFKRGNGALGTGPTATNPNSNNGKWNVAIIGAGMAGAAAAYELQRLGGNIAVTLFNATKRVGGRTWSHQFESDKPELAELGAMRFPPTEETLFYYLDKFGITTTPDFPDPGQVPTLMRYRGKNYRWDPPAVPLPDIFTKVNRGWNAFVADGKPEMGLVAPLTIYKALQDWNYTDPVPSVITSNWQIYLDNFVNKSFYQGLVTVFSDDSAPGGEPWNFEDYAVFAALGVGSGGFGSLYGSGFLEIVRLIVNGLETNQVFIRSGIASVVDAFLKQGSISPVIFPITKITRTAVGNEVQFRLQVSDGTTHGPYDRVIVATTTRAMQVDLGIDSESSGLFPPQQVNVSSSNEAIRRLHMINSSKLFIRTKDKFWLKNKDKEGNSLPHTIQSDTLIRGLYCLDYDPGNLDSPGVVLISYTWEDDAAKTQTLGLIDRVRALRADVNRFFPEFGAYLDPIAPAEDNLIQVDWQLEPHYYGAFKLHKPGQDTYVFDVFHHFLLGADKDSPYKGFFLAGDGISWSGGWTEGALQTGLNAMAGVLQSLVPHGAKFASTDYNPVVTLAERKGTYRYHHPE